MKRLFTVALLCCKRQTAYCYCLLLSFLLGTTGLFAQTSVTVTPITANYSSTPPTVKFKVSWSSRDANHRSKVWLLVDYKRIKGNAYTGDWLRAGIDVLPTANAGTVSLESGNDKGFWLQGTDGAFAATVTVPVTVDFTGYSKSFGWCGVASDRPPHAVETSGHYALYGTKPFIIQTHPTNNSNTVTENSNTYSGCIYGLTDATGCPGDPPALPAITSLTPSPATICAGQPATLTASASNAASYSLSGSTWQTASTFAVSPTASTYYIIYIKSAAGCTASKANAARVTVHTASTAPTTLAASTATVCANGAVTLTASGGTLGTAASYQFGTGSSTLSTGTATTYVVNPTATTTYWVKIVTTSACAAPAGTPTRAITVRPNFASGAIATTGQTICYGASVNTIGSTTAASGGDGTISYQWYNDSSSITGATATTYSPDAYKSNAGTHTFTRRAKDNTCNTTLTAATGSWVLVINALPATPTGASTNTRCGTGTVTFSATAPANCTIDWYNDATSGATVATGVSYSPIVSATTSYYAQARNTTTGCVSTARLTVTGTVCPDCVSWTTCDGFTEISDNVVEPGGTKSLSDAGTLCQKKGDGWRLPTLTELTCICKNKCSLPGGPSNYGFWSQTNDTGSYYFAVAFGNCVATPYLQGTTRYVKCVK